MSSVAQLDAPHGLARPLAHNPRKNVSMQPFTNMSESMPGDPMDITSPSSSSMGPPANSSPELEQGGNVNGNVDNNIEIHTGSGVRKAWFFCWRGEIVAHKVNRILERFVAKGD